MRIDLRFVLRIAPFMVALAVLGSPAYGVPAYGAQSASVYASASLRLAKASVADLSAGRTAARALLRTVQSNCRDALAGAPNGEALEILEDDLEGAAAVAVARVNVVAVHTFVVDKLTWRPMRIGELVGKELWALRHEIALNPPSICADARTWHAGGFQKPPAAGVRFANEFGAFLAGPESGEPIRTAIARYTSANVKDRLREVNRLERRVDSVQTKEWLAVVSKIRATLGLPSTDITMQ
jgi:hypothetical protein